MSATFSIDVTRWVAKTKADMDTVCRKIALELHARIVLRSPVGNPELWAANAEAALQRTQHNSIVDQINANLASDPANLTANGNLRRSVRSRANRKLSRSALAREYPFRQGQGYTGGRFRGAWTVTVNTPSTTEPGRIDPSGGATIDAAAAALASFTAGPSIYILNNVPYALRLEYGWSRQAPAGVVRITAAEFTGIAAAAAANPTPDRGPTP